MFAQPCASDASTLIPASQFWCVPFLALICLGALAAGDGEQSMGPSSFGTDGVLPPNTQVLLSPSATK